MAPYNKIENDDGSTNTSSTGTSDNTISDCASEWVDDDLDHDDASTLNASANDIPDGPSNQAGVVAINEKTKKKDDSQDDSVPAGTINTVAIIDQAEEASSATYLISKNGHPDTGNVDADRPSVSRRRNDEGFLSSTGGSASDVFRPPPFSSPATTQRQDQVVDPRPRTRETRAPFL